MSPAARAGVPRPVTLGVGIALALGMVAAARAFRRPPPEEPRASLVVQPGGLPAPGVTVWCGLLDEEAAARGRGRSPRVWIRGQTDAAGRLRFEREPEYCVFHGDGVDVLGAARPATDSGSVHITVVPSFRCESAMIVMERQADWVLSWYRRAKGFSRVRSANASSLESSARELWLEHGERRHPQDRVRDCAIVVMDSRPTEALSALAALTRPIVAGHPDPGGGFLSRETDLPALDTRVWSAGALCAWVATPLPRELFEALPYGLNCDARPAPIPYPNTAPASNVTDTAKPKGGLTANDAAPPVGEADGG